MRQQFACDTDAHKALKQWIDKQDFIRIDDAKVIRQEKRTKRGRPGINDEVVTTFQISGAIVTDPDMKKKPTQSPTARWVFFCFQGVSVLLIDKTTEVVTNIIDRHKIILNCLGKPYWEFYSSAYCGIWALHFSGISITTLRALFIAVLLIIYS